MIGKRKTVKFCAFRDGNCSYGDKCRFSHADGRVYFQTNVSQKSKKLRSEIHALNDVMNRNTTGLNNCLSYYMNETPGQLQNETYAITGKLVRVELPTKSAQIHFGAIPDTQVSFTMALERDYNNTFLHQN